MLRFSKSLQLAMFHKNASLSFAKRRFKNGSHNQNGIQERRDYLRNFLMDCRKLKFARAVVKRTPPMKMRSGFRMHVREEEITSRPCNPGQLSRNAGQIIDITKNKRRGEN